MAVTPRTSSSGARRRGTALLAAAFALAVAACGGGGDGAAATSGGATTEAGTPAVPGVKEFGLTEQEFAAHVEKTQSLIAACMREAGFEYVPVDVQTIEAAQKRVRQDPGVTEAEYKQKYGFGITTRFDNPVRDTGLGPQNLQTFKNLSKADQVAYNRTLFGDDPTADFAFTLDEEDFSSTGGCTRKAVAQVFTPEQLKGTYENPKDVLVQSDPRVTAARQEWVKCMRAEGYDYATDQDEIIEEYQDKLDELTEGADPATLTGERAAELRKLQAEEVAAALVDFDCETKHTTKIVRQVELEVFGRVVSG